MPALLTSPNKVASPSEADTAAAARLTAGASVTSKTSGVNAGPNSRASRSASAALRTLPKTRKPSATRTFAAPHPMPVDAPVTTTVRGIGLLYGMLARMTSQFDRRTFLRTAGALAGGGLVARYAPTGLAAFQANSPDAMRNQMGAAAIETTKLTAGLVLMSGTGGNVLVLHGQPNGKLLVDGFVKPAWQKLKGALDALGADAVKTVIDTHWHFDHADNNGNLRQAGAGIIAHDNTALRLSEPHDLLGMHFEPAPKGELPTQTFTSGLSVNHNGEAVRLTSVPPAHTDTDIFVHFQKANVLHMGDVFFNGFYPFIDASTGGHINGMIDGVTAALKIVNATTKIVPGHGPLGDREALQAFGRMLTGVRDNVRTLKASGKSLADVKAAKPTADFDAAWAKGGGMAPDAFVELVYNTVR